MNELTQRGITALRSGDRAAARTLLSEAIRLDSDDATAWLWLTGALDSDDERIGCLKQVLRIDPGNQAAARGLSQILARQTQQEERPTHPHKYQERPTAAEVRSGDDGQGAADISKSAYSAEETEVEEESATIGNLDLQNATTWMYETPVAEEADQLPHQSNMTETTLPAATATKRRRVRTASEPLQMIFRTRPSLVPALISFWFFFIGSAAIGILLREDTIMALIFSLGLGFILMMVVVYALIRNFSTRYELTNHYLSLRYRGKPIRMPLSYISQAECRQTSFQGIIGTGDILLKAEVHHELVNLRMRNVPECRRRVEQIQSAVSSADGSDLKS